MLSEHNNLATENVINFLFPSFDAFGNRTLWFYIFISYLVSMGILQAIAIVALAMFYEKKYAKRIIKAKPAVAHAAPAEVSEDILSEE